MGCVAPKVTESVSRSPQDSQSPTTQLAVRNLKESAKNYKKANAHFIYEESICLL